jgi:hypothetical protein
MIIPRTEIKREFKTPLGVIRCGFTCKGRDRAIETKQYENVSSEIFKTNGHKIEIVSFKIKVPLYNGDSLTDSFGWIFRIEKRLQLSKSLKPIVCLTKSMTK